MIELHCDKCSKTIKSFSHAYGGSATVRHTEGEYGGAGSATIDLPGGVHVVEIPGRGTRMLCTECQAALNAALREF